MKQTCLRECREETGIMVPVPSLVSLYRGPCNQYTTYTFTVPGPPGRKRFLVPRSSQGRRGPEGIVVLGSVRNLLSGRYGRYNAAVLEAFCAAAPTWTRR